MVDIKISGRKLNVTDGMRDRVNEKIGEALRVFEVQPMSCDVVLRVDKNPSNPERKTCETTVFVRDSVVRVTASSTDMYSAIDEAADKVERQLRKYKTKVIDKHKRNSRGMAHPELEAVTAESLSQLIEPAEEDDQLVREKVIELKPMTEEEALVQTDLLGHDFYVFENATTGLINVIYHRHNGGYGIIKPRIESEDDE
ncbi:MAG: ribosome-associated translation inhibitor RaiA [Atopobiaceae bacterium]|nr:ribosome-associated translation inhibitor RaiA [Atopobiaceae bacterium]MDO4403883.1 ribosome-associated translation inhibitor RaiA [Atopobiaceae bacterium]